MKDYCFKIGKFMIHNKEQWDLNCKPKICIHMNYNHGNGCKRILCWR